MSLSQTYSTRVRHRDTPKCYLRYIQLNTLSSRPVSPCYLGGLTPLINVPIRSTLGTSGRGTSKDWGVWVLPVGISGLQASSFKLQASRSASTHELNGIPGRDHEPLSFSALYGMRSNTVALLYISVNLLFWDFKNRICKSF